MAAFLAASQWSVNQMFDKNDEQGEFSVIKTSPGYWPRRKFSLKLRTVDTLVSALCTSSLKLYSDDMHCSIYTRLKAFYHLPFLQEESDYSCSPRHRAGLLARAMSGRLHKEDSAILRRTLTAGRESLGNERTDVLAQQFWLGDCPADRFMYGTLALASAVDIHATARDRADARAQIASTAKLGAAVSPTQVFETVLDELETLRKEWDARTENWEDAYENYAKEYGILLHELPAKKALQRTLSVTVAAELFDNCCGRLGVREKLTTAAGTCEHLVFATMLSRQTC